MVDGDDTTASVPVHEAPVHPPLDEIAFAHASERVAAEILDFYRIRWQYEPTDVSASNGTVRAG